MARTSAGPPRLERLYQLLSRLSVSYLRSTKLATAPFEVRRIVSIRSETNYNETCRSSDRTNQGERCCG